LGYFKPNAEVYKRKFCLQFVPHIEKDKEEPYIELKKGETVRAGAESHFFQQILRKLISVSSGL